MFVNKQELTTRLTLSENSFTNLLLGVHLFLFFSFYRGFITVSLAYILAILPQEQGAALAIVPALILFIPDKFTLRIRSALNFTMIVWITSIFITNLLFKYIVIMIGLGMVYLTIKSIATSDIRPENLGPSIVIAIVLDLGLKSANFGTDPIVSVNIIGGFFAVVAAMLFTYTFYLNSDYAKFEPNTAEDRTDVSSLAIFGLCMNLLIFFAFFANPGISIIIFKMPNHAGTILFTLISGVLVYLTYMLHERGLESELISTIVASIVLFVSLLRFPWFWPEFPLWGLGLIANAYLSIIAIRRISTSNHLAFVSSFFFGLVFFIALLFLLIASDNSPVALLAGIFVLVTLISSVYQGTKKGGVV